MQYFHGNFASGVSYVSNREGKVFVFIYVSNREGKVFVFIYVLIILIYALGYVHYHIVLLLLSCVCTMPPVHAVSLTFQHFKFDRGPGLFVLLVMIIVICVFGLLQ